MHVRASRLVPATYRPVLANRVLRRLLLGFGVSYLGDGMSFVAVAWLAIELAPQATAGLWVGGAVAAYTLPGVVGALVFGRRLRRVPAKRLLLTDNVVRGVFLGAVPLAWLAGALTPPLYVVLLAVSSLLHAWGNAGKYTMLAELLPEDQRLAANTLVSSLNFAATIAGPAIAGVLVTYVSSALVLGLDALTYVFLAALVVRARLPGSGRVDPVGKEAARGGFALLRSRPELLGLLTLTWFFNFMYGPVEVALPLHVTDDLHGPGTLLGLYWMLFGIGAVLGGLAVGALRQLPLWPVTVAIVVGWGLSLLPFAFDVPTAVTVASFTLGGAIYGPFVALSVTLMQEKSPPQYLAAMLAARSAALLTASPLGSALGGPLTTELGPRATLGGSGLATVALGAVACALLWPGAGAAATASPRSETTGQTDQESRSAGHRPAHSVRSRTNPRLQGVTMTGSTTQGIQTVLHPVSDLEKAKAVYSALLGIQPQTDGPYYVGFEAEGQQIGLVPGGGPQGMTSPVAYWHVADIEAKLAEVTAAGATVKESPHDVGGGRLVATVTDPDGNVLGLLQDR